MLFRIAALVCALVAMPLRAQSDPLELARGLREIGQPDLSLEYLDDLAKKKPTADVLTVLPLERAKSILAIAQMETEEAAREGGVAQARAEFETFILKNAKHPRVAEAQLSLAQVTAVQAVGQLQRARKLSGPNPAETAKRRATGIAEARKLFVTASTLFGDASKNITAQLNDAGTTPPRKRELQSTSLQAELDRGINLFRLVETYTSPSDAEKKERSKNLDDARAIFLALGKKSEASAIVWTARAWQAMCEYENGAPADADKIFKAVKLNGGKVPAGADGVRMVQFFETLIKYIEAVSELDAAKVQNARSEAKNWLDKDRYKPRMTPQRLSMTFYFANLTDLLGRSEMVFAKQSKEEIAGKKPPKFLSVRPEGLRLLKEASRSYKTLLEFDNEYTERAADKRTQAVRLIVGEVPKPAKDYNDLEECQMASLVQLMRANDAKADAAKLEDDEDKAKLEAAKKKEVEEFAKVFALVERSRALLNAKTPAREVAETKLNHMFAYFYAGDYAKAAESGEDLARNSRGSLAAQGGYYAIESMLKSREKLESATAAEKTDGTDGAIKALRDKAIALGLFLDKTFAGDVYADAARLRVGQLYTQDKQYQLAFDILGRISPKFTDVAAARSLQGRAAFFLISGKESPLDAKAKAAVFQKAVADCQAVPMPASPNGLKSYFSVRTLLATLHLLDDPKGPPEAERIAAETMKAIATSTLEPAEKPALIFAADETRLRGILSQSRKLYADGKYKELSAKMLPSLAEMSKSGPAAKADLEGEARQAAANLDNYRRDFIVFAMQGRLREKEFDKATELFELLDKLGGSTEATTNALNRTVALVRPQMEAFRKEKKNDEADKLAASIGNLLKKQSEKPKLATMVVASLGRSLRDLGQYDKAVEVLTKVPQPPAADLYGDFSTLAEEKRDPVIAWQIARIEMSRSYRAMKKFPEADAVLKNALGDESAKPDDPKAKGWAKSLEFKKEAVYLLEDKAANLPPETRQKAWLEAKAGWEKIAGGYAGLLRLPDIDPNDDAFKSIDGKPPAKKGIEPNVRARLIPIYVDVLFEYRRCLARANSQLITDPTKLNETLAKMGASVFEIETTNVKYLNADLKSKFAGLLNDYPAMKEEYKKRGGKAFLEGG